MWSPRWTKGLGLNFQFPCLHFRHWTAPSPWNLKLTSPVLIVQLFDLFQRPLQRPKVGENLRKILRVSGTGTKTSSHTEFLTQKRLIIAHWGKVDIKERSAGKFCGTTWWWQLGSCTSNLSNQVNSACNVVLRTGRAPRKRVIEMELYLAWVKLGAILPCLCCSPPYWECVWYIDHWFWVMIEMKSGFSFLAFSVCLDSVILRHKYMKS